jgi:hypothetical protein
MVLEYLTNLKAKHGHKDDVQAQPILNDEDEKFLERITSEEAPPPLPERPVVIFDNGKKAVGKDAQIALLAGANEIPLPVSPPVEGDLEEGKIDESKAGSTNEKKKKDYWSYVPSIRYPGKVSYLNIYEATLTTG